MSTDDALEADGPPDFRVYYRPRPHNSAIVVSYRRPACTATAHAAGNTTPLCGDGDLSQSRDCAEKEVDHVDLLMCAVPDSNGSAKVDPSPVESLTDGSTPDDGDDGDVGMIGLTTHEARREMIEEAPAGSGGGGRGGGGGVLREASRASPPREQQTTDETAAHRASGMTRRTAKRRTRGVAANTNVCTPHAQLDASLPTTRPGGSLHKMGSSSSSSDAGGDPEAVCRDGSLVTLREAQLIYTQAKEHLELCQGTTASTRREEYEEEMVRFWQEHVLERKAGSLYVSGSPGTGKTLTLTRVVERMKKWEKNHREENPFQVVELNAMQMKAEQIEEALVKALDGAPGKRIEDLLTDPRRLHMTVVILDELDQLIMAKQTDILYKLFGISVSPSSSLVFIGVANALRLRESLPLLQTAKYGDVKQVTFESYNLSQLLDILKERQTKMGYRLFDDIALQLCASQAAKMSGDARKALHLAKLAVESVLKTLPGSWGSQERRALPRVSAMQMSQTMAGVLGQASKRVEQIRALPTLQQLLLCCFVVARGQLAARNQTGTLPWKQVFDAYRAACAREGFGAVGPSEFGDMCAALEGHALISTTRAKGGAPQGLLLQVSDSELRSAVSPIKSLARVLPDVVP